MPAAAKKQEEITHEIQEIPVSKLVPSDINMRQSSPDDTKANKTLKASIKAFGVLQNFIVHPQGKKFGVAGGGRRLRMLQELIADGEIPKATKVNCKVVSKDDALSATIAENYHRHDPHPVDECRAFLRLAEREGMTMKQISEEFGVGTQYVKQRLALAKVHPDILEQFINDKIGLGATAAYTIVEDQEKQLAVFKQLEPWERGNSQRIRSKLCGSPITVKDWRVKLVGLKAYKDAGGEVAGDLFENDSRIHNIELLDSLVKAKVDEKVEALKADGWSWVEVVEGYFRLWDWNQIDGEFPDDLKQQKAKLEAEFKRLEAELENVPDDDETNDELQSQYWDIETKLDDFDSDHADQVEYSAEQKAGAGVVVNLNSGIDVYQGLVKPEDVTPSEVDSSTTVEQQPKEKYSQVIRDLIGYTRKSGARVELYRNYPDLLVQLAEFTIVDKEFGTSFDSSILDISMPGRHNSDVRSDLADWPADKDFADGLAELDMSWREGDIGERFAKYRALPQLAQVCLYHAALARSLRIGLRGRNSLADAIVDELQIDYTKYFAPTAENFFSRVSKDVINEALDGAFNEVPEGCAKMKKGELAEFAGQEWQHENKPKWLPEGF